MASLYVSSATVCTNTTSNVYTGGWQVSNSMYDTSITWDDAVGWMQVVQGAKLLNAGRTYDLPDGARLEIDEFGNYTINDKEAKVIYRAHRNRDFNPLVNAGDRVADFIRYVKTIPGVRQDQIAHLPLGLFVQWLITEAAERDGDPVPEPIADSKRLLAAARQPRCHYCQRWIRKGHLYCEARCFTAHNNLLLQKETA